MERHMALAHDDERVTAGDSRAGRDSPEGEAVVEHQGVIGVVEEGRPHPAKIRRPVIAHPGAVDSEHQRAYACLLHQDVREGDLQVGQIGGPLNAQLSGSGSLRTGATGGSARLALNGSGNVNAGAVNGALDADLRGSGSMRVASVSGESADLNLTSSGTLVVSGGQVARLAATSTGSGSVRYGGSAGVTRASLTGSGSITIHDAGRVESLSDTGSGSINVGR